MFGKITKFHGSSLIEVEIITSELPATMPLVSDGIDNLGSGYTLAPGSTMIVTGADKRYILGENGEWEEVSTDGSKSVEISGTATESPITDSANGMMQGLTVYGRSRTTKNFAVTPLAAGVTVTPQNVTYTFANDEYVLTAAGVDGGQLKISPLPNIINGQTVRLSYDCSASNPNAAPRVFLNNNDTGVGYGWGVIGVGHRSETIALPYSTKGYDLYLRVNQGSYGSIEIGDTVTISNLQIEIGSVETDFESFLSFDGIKSVGDAKWGVMDFTDIVSADWSLYAPPSNYAQSKANFINIASVSGFCNKLQIVDVPRVNLMPLDSITFNVETGRVFVRTDKTTSWEEFKEYLSGIKLYYPLADPSTGVPRLIIQTDNGETGDVYKSTVADITTGMSLHSIDNLRDELTIDQSGGQVVSKCAEVDLGDLTWIYGESVFVSSIISNQPIIPGSGDDGLCSRYTVTKSTQFNMPDKTILIGSGSVSAAYRVCVKDSDYTDATTFKAAVTGVKLVYPLAEPIITPLTASEVAEFRQLRTFEGKTNITITDEPEFEIDYLKNTDNGQAIAAIQDSYQAQINALEERVAALET